MPEKLRSTNISPENTFPSYLIRSCKIHVGGKVLHALVGGGKSLSDTFQGFLKATDIEVKISSESSQAIVDFCENESGAMILNHPNNSFIDYIPLLAQIPESILAKTTFFALKNTVPMFKREFGEKYNFVEATFDSISEARQGLQELGKATERVNAGEGYIFIIPGGAESEGSEIHEGFKALFKRMVQKLPKETPLLAGNISYPNDIGYLEVYKRALKGKIGKDQEGLTATLRAKNITTGDFSQDDSREMKTKYEKLFSS